MWSRPLVGASSVLYAYITSTHLVMRSFAFALYSNSLHPSARDTGPDVCRSLPMLHSGGIQV